MTAEQIVSAVLDASCRGEAVERVASILSDEATRLALDRAPHERMARDAAHVCQLLRHNPMRDSYEVAATDLAYHGLLGLFRKGRAA